MRRSSAIRTAGLVGTAMLAGCTATSPPGPAQTAATVPAKPASGPAQSCIPIVQIREAKVVDDRTIDFIMNDRRVLRSTLPYSCPQLGFEKAFTYATSLSQLCSSDIITVIIQGGGIRRGASCGLGQFVPYTPIPPSSASK